MEQDWRIIGFPGSGLSNSCVPLSDSVAEHTDLCAALYTDNYDHLIYQAEGNESLVNRMESLHGIHTLEHAEEIGLGSRTYELVKIDG